MKNRKFSRREFSATLSAAAAFSALQPVMTPFIVQKKRNRMILSFYLDDTNPKIVSAEAYRTFTDYCNDNSIKGETSFIAGYEGKSILREHDKNQSDYLKYVSEAWKKGLDTHMEIMTHNTLFDFSSGEKNPTGIHEGLWLHEPGVTEQVYYEYFSNITAEAEKAGIRYTGFTWPGCGCEACTKRYAELRKEGPLHISQAAFNALLRLARENKFRSRVLPVFYESDESGCKIHRRAADGKYGIYDLMPNALDQFGIWENSKDRVNPDYYITEDGKSGIIIKHYENNEPYCLWYGHWQGLNPEKGVGWAAFKTVNERIRKHLSGKIVFMRPSDIVTAYHDAGGWGFTDKL